MNSLNLRPARSKLISEIMQIKTGSFDRRATTIKYVVEV